MNSVNEKMAGPASSGDPSTPAVLCTAIYVNRTRLFHHFNTHVALLGVVSSHPVPFQVLALSVQLLYGLQTQFQKVSVRQRFFAMEHHRLVTPTVRITHQPPTNPPLHLGTPN